MSKRKIPQKLLPWLEAKKRHHLSDMHLQMARELGMNPKKLGKLDNHKQEPWKLPLPQFIEKLYLKSFKRPRPEKIVSLKVLKVKGDSHQIWRIQATLASLMIVSSVFHEAESSIPAPIARPCL
jgi:hypothetical protein